MKKATFLYVCLSMVFMTSHAQLIDSKVDLHLGVSLGSFIGKENTTDGNFISPSLFANYNSVKGFAIKGLVKRNSSTSVGVELRYGRAENWKHSTYTDYEDSGVTQYSFYPVIRLHTKFKELGMANRLKGFIEIAPTVGLSKLLLTHPLFDIKDQNGSVARPLSEWNIYAGGRLSGGTDFSVTRSAGVFFACSMQYNWIKSKLFHDDSFKAIHIDFGLYLRLSKDKRYFY